MLQRCGISEGLVRVACGIEATQDLIEDFELALASIGGKANALSLGSSNGPALGEVSYSKSKNHDCCSIIKHAPDVAHVVPHQLAAMILPL